MLALEAMGMLAESRVFNRKTLEVSDLENVRITSTGLQGEYEELLDPLRAAGRSDLSEALERTIRRESRRRALASVRRRLGTHLRQRR